MKTNSGKRVMSIFAHIVLILLSFMCLFFFAILLINATHSHAELQKGFSIIPGKHFLDNLRSCLLYTSCPGCGKACNLYG